MKKVILIGNGGHSKVIQAMIDRADEYKLIGILDESIGKYREEENIFYDNTDYISKYKEKGHFVIAIGNNDLRKKIIKDNLLKDEDFISIVDATSLIASDVEVGIGTVVMPGVIINPGTTIGNHSIINTRAVVEHDNTVGDFVHISPSATLAGTVTVKDLVHIGSGATVIPNKTIDKNSIIGAGSVVTEDIQHNSIVVGVPAKIVKRR